MRLFLVVLALAAVTVGIGTIVAIAIDTSIARGIVATVLSVFLWMSFSELLDQFDQRRNNAR